MTRTIAIMNQHPAVGKTTTTVNLGHALALRGKKVTVIDLDPQGELTEAFNKKETELGLGQVLLDDISIDQAVIKISDDLQLVPAGSLLQDYENSQQGGLSRAKKLKKIIGNPILQEQDFILIDCPEKPGLLTLNALFVANEVVIPTANSYSALQGLARVIQLVKRVNTSASQLNKLWIVLTRVDKAKPMAQEIKDKILNFFPDRVFKTDIQEKSVIAECKKVMKTVFDFEQDSTSAQDFLLLAQDIIDGRTY